MSRRGISIALLSAGAALAGCGGTTSTTHSTRATAPAPHLPRLFASDQPVDKGHVVTAHDQGTVVASDGFNPAVDGFSFENYGFIAGVEINQHDLREMFGDAVCADAPSDACTLTPAAQQFAQQVSDGMLGGHCFGFSVTALRFFRHLLSQSDFGGTSTFSLGLSPSLVSEIAYGWAMQLLPAVQNAAIAQTPTNEIKILTKALANPSAELYTIGIRNPQGGHAVTPITIDNLGGGQYAIQIYDNNFPGQVRDISVDTNSDTWSYNGAPNPTVPPEEYTGQGTNNPMELFALSAGLGRQPCPFCGSGSTAAQRGMLQVSLGGDPDAHGHLLITTANGRHLGYLHGRLVNQIKGARVYVPLLNSDFLAHPEPIYFLPAGAGRLRISLDGSGATGHDAATIHVTGPGFGTSVSNLLPQSGSTDQLSLSATTGQVSFRSSGAGSGQNPVLSLGVNHGQGGSALSVIPKTLATGAPLTVSLKPAANRVSVQAGTSAAATPVALSLTQVGSFGRKTARAVGVSRPSGGASTFSLALVKQS